MRLLRACRARTVLDLIDKGIDSEGALEERLL